MAVLMRALGMLSRRSRQGEGTTTRYCTTRKTGRFVDMVI